MKKLAVAVMSGVMLIGAASLSYADGSKMGVVDVQKIMQTSAQVKQIQAQLEKEFKPRRDKLMQMEESMKNDMDKFKRDAAIMNDSQKKDLEKKIVSQQRQLEFDGQQYQQDLNAAQNDAMKKLYGKVRDAVSKIAKSEQYDVIVQKDATLFDADKLDVTDKVLKEIN